MQNRKNILQVTAALDTGGVERGTLEMAEFIAKLGWGSFVSSAGGRLVKSLIESEAKHIYLPLNRRDPITIFFCALRLKQIIQDNNIDLVHARSRAPAWAAWLACKWTGTPFITTFHGTHKIQNELKRKYNSVMVKGERVIAISNFIKKHIIEEYNIAEEQIDIAPRGFNPEIFSPNQVTKEDMDKLRKIHSIPVGIPIILMPGRLTRWKGQHIFIEALKELAGKPFHAIIVGGAGKKRSYLLELRQKVNQLGLAGKVTFCGTQSNMPAFYNIADVVVSASIEPEAFGRVAVEAQAMGKPVVATNHGGSTENIQNGITGWLVEPNNSKVIGEQLANAISRPKILKDMGKKAQKWVHDNFTTQQTCEAEFKAYTKVLNNRL